VRRLTATDAARRFSSLLDQVEQTGETFVVERRGRAIASIAPAAASSGREVKDILQARAADPGWSSELHKLRGSLTPEARPWNA
jgi:antitoxin (DNA-binding transcriptional repressor) of toxin-antitoxin stability system